MRLLFLFLLMNFIGFSQEKEDTNKTQPLFISTMNIDSSFNVQDNLDAVSNSIKTISTSKINLDRISNRNLVALTKNSNKIYKFSDINSEINIKTALDNVMYSGNFFNPNESHYSVLDLNR